MNEEGGIPPTPPETPTAPPPGPPPGDPPAGPPGRPGNPWERRGELGVANGFVEAIKGFVTAPARTFEETKESGDLASPLAFAVILAIVVAIVGQIWSMILGASVLSVLPLPDEAQQAFGWLLASSGFGLVAALILTPIFTIIGLFIWSAILHLMLLLVGGLERSGAGYEGSLRVVAYAQSVASLAQLVPIIGGIIGLVWGLFLLVTGITRLHGTTDGKAIAAVLLPVVFCCACIAAMVVFGGFAAFMGANQ